MTALSLAVAASLAGCPEDSPADPDSAVTHTDSGTPQDGGVIATEDAPATPEDGGATGDDGGPVVVEPSCSTVTDATYSEAVERLCEIEGTVRHFTIDGIAVPSPHGYAQIVFGVAGPTELSQMGFEEHEVRVTLYGGAPGLVGPSVFVQSNAFSGVTTSPYVPFTNDTATVCGDVDPGSAERAARIVVWVDGEDGADCADRATLTLASAAIVQTDWSNDQTIAPLSFAQYGQTGLVETFPTITLSAEPAVTDEDFEASERCETPVASTTDWQPVCTPARGDGVHHVRLEDLSAHGTSRFAYLIFGAPADSTGNPAPVAGDRQLIVTMGASHMATSWTYFRFNGPTPSTQFEFQTDAPDPDPEPAYRGLYTAAPSTVCLDLGTTSDDHLRVVFWATGANGADCSDWSTLSLTNALYDSTTDTAGAAMWNALLADGDGLADFVKFNNVGTGATPDLSATRVVRFARSAVL